MLFWSNDYSRGLAGHMRPVTSAVRPASAQCCSLCHLSSDGLEESERYRSQKIYRSSEENRPKWVLFRIAIYRSSGYNLIFCPAVSAELPGVLTMWTIARLRPSARWYMLNMCDKLLFAMWYHGCLSSLKDPFTWTHCPEALDSVMVLWIMNDIYLRN